MKEIKKCPFCGGNHLDVSLINVEHTNHDTTIPGYVVRNAPPAIRIICRTCTASMFKSFGVKDEVYSEIKIINEITDELIDKWNQRVQEISQDKLTKLNQLAEWEDEVHNRAIHNTEWEQGLDNREDELRHKEEEINEKLQKYQAIRDEMAKLLKNIDDQNNEIYKRINDLLENTEDEDGDAPLGLLNLMLSTSKNAKNNTTEQS